MEEKILNYFRDQYNINVSQLIVSGAKNGRIGMINVKDQIGERIPWVYTIQKDENETDFYLFFMGEEKCQGKIDCFIHNLKSFIQENSIRPVIKSSYDKEWYFWQDSHVKISFGIRSEKTGFSMRLSFPNNELKLYSYISHKTV